MQLSVIIPTHNPDEHRLNRTLAGLRTQTLPAAQWEVVVVDNRSNPPVAVERLTSDRPANFRIVREETLGLSFARRRGLRETARSPFGVLVDDDNVLGPDYLANVVQLFGANRHVGLMGGCSVPEFERTPQPWQTEFFSLLAVRDLGRTVQISSGLRSDGSTHNQYPPYAPIGAGMAFRREAIEPWLHATEANPLTDRCGSDLTSGGDNDIVLSAMQHGWEVGYFPSLTLTHLIPANRLDTAYLARLNRGIQTSWIQVLSKYDANPWPPIPPWTQPLRQIKAWLKYRAWSGPAAYVRWQGACGHFEGRASVFR